MLTKIRHIFPYLYYRSYQYYEKREKNRDPKFMAFSWVIVIKIAYLISFVILPLDIILFDGVLGNALDESVEKYTKLGVILMLAPVGCLILYLGENKRKKYHDMIPLWNNETKSQRKIKWWILFFVCGGAFVSFIPVIIILNCLFPRPENENKTELIIQEETPRKQLILEEIDDSQLWGIKRGEKEIQVVEEGKQ